MRFPAMTDLRLPAALLLSLALSPTASADDAACCVQSTSRLDEMMNPAR
jgi:hypothetical protein